MASIDEFLNEIKANSELQQALTKCSDPNEAVQIAKDAGFNISAQELLDSYRSKLAELSEEELAAVSGAKSGKQEEEAHAINEGAKIVFGENPMV